MQYALFAEESGEIEIRSDGWVRREEVVPFKTQLLKWIGNKQKFAHEIIGTFPRDYGTYHEPFIGAGGVMAALSPGRAIGSDAAVSPDRTSWRKNTFSVGNPLQDADDQR